MSCGHPIPCEVEDDGAGSWFVAVSADGRRWRVRGTTPGDEVAVRPRRDDPGWADLVAVRAPGPWRRPAGCALAGACGGCHWLAVTDEGQAELKARRVQAALRAAEVPEPASSRFVAATAAPSARCRARFQAAPTADGGLDIGFHALGARRVVDAPSCPLLTAELAEAYAALRRALRGDPPPTLTGLEVVALPGAPGALALLNPRDAAPEPWPRVGQDLLVATSPHVVGVTAQLAGDDPRPRVVGAAHVVGHSPRGRPVAAAAGGFVQAHLGMAELMADHVVRLAAASDGERVVELFAGAGFLSWRLAGGGARVLAFERHAPSVSASRALPLPRPGSLEVRAEGAEASLEAVDARTVLVADPPRQGLGTLADAIASRNPDRVVVAWCSLDGLRRDVRCFHRAGYRLDELVALDMFPQTRHVEVVARLVR